MFDGRMILAIAVGMACSFLSLAVMICIDGYKTNYIRRRDIPRGTHFYRK